MMQHEMTNACWCEPFVDEFVCEDGHVNNITIHHDENGAALFYLPDGVDMVFCCDCDEPMPELMPDPEWLLASGFMSWRVIRNEPGDRHLGYGVDVFRPDDHVDQVSVGFTWGSRRFMIDFSGRKRQKPVSDQVKEMAPKMLDQIEQHLKTHG